LQLLLLSSVPFCIAPYQVRKAEDFRPPSSGLHNDSSKARFIYSIDGSASVSYQQCYGGALPFSLSVGDQRQDLRFTLWALPSYLVQLLAYLSYTSYLNSNQSISETARSAGALEKEGAAPEATNLNGLRSYSISSWLVSSHPADARELRGRAQGELGAYIAYALQRMNLVDSPPAGLHPLAIRIYLFNSLR
jgi:hypothetical protein